MAIDNYIVDGVVVPVTHRGPPTSQYRGICWNKSLGKWVAKCKGTFLGHHATEEAAAQAYHIYVEDSIIPVKHRDPSSSQFKGVSWIQKLGKWRAQSKGECLGYHATEEVAALAYNKYVADGVVPEKRRKDTSSQFKGVCWHKRDLKWRAMCAGKDLGSHATEEAAVQAGAYPLPLFSSTSAVLVASPCPSV